MERNGAFAWRYAYGRAAETRAAGDSGQDYLALTVGPESLAFTLCDGVSQSFFGELAARLLGDALVAWLHDDVGNDRTPETALRTLRVRLLALMEPACAAVRAYPLPANLAPMLRQVLEQKRAFGSESTFICGRLDRPGPASPRGQLLLAWMGDSRIRVWGNGRERSGELGGDFSADRRWSSQRGLVGGDPHLFLGPLTGPGAITRLVTYSDGLSALDRVNRLLSNSALQEVITAAEASSASDDIAYLELWVGDPPAPILAAHADETATDRSPAPPAIAHAGAIPHTVGSRPTRVGRPPLVAANGDRSPMPPGGHLWVAPVALAVTGAFLIGLLAIGLIVAAAGDPRLNIAATASVRPNSPSKGDAPAAVGNDHGSAAPKAVATLGMAPVLATTPMVVTPISAATLTTVSATTMSVYGVRGRTAGGAAAGGYSAGGPSMVRTTWVVSASSRVAAAVATGTPPFETATPFGGAQALSKDSQGAAVVPPVASNTWTATPQPVASTAPSQGGGSRPASNDQSGDRNAASAPTATGTPFLTATPFAATPPANASPRGTTSVTAGGAPANATVTSSAIAKTATGAPATSDSSSVTSANGSSTASAGATGRSTASSAGAATSSPVSSAGVSPIAMSSSSSTGARP